MSSPSDGVASGDTMRASELNPQDNNNNNNYDKCEMASSIVTEIMDAADDEAKYPERDATCSTMSISSSSSTSSKKRSEGIVIYSAHSVGKSDKAKSDKTKMDGECEMSEEDALAMFPPDLSRTSGGLQRVVTPGAFPSGGNVENDVGSEHDEEDASPLRTSLHSARSSGVYSSRSSGYGYGGEMNSQRTSLNRRTSQDADNIDIEAPEETGEDSSHDDITATAVPIEATLVGDEHIPPPTKPPIAQVSDEVVIATPLQDTEKNESNENQTQRLKRLYAIIALVLIVVSVAVSVVMTLYFDSKVDGDDDLFSSNGSETYVAPYNAVTHHAVIFGGMTTCNTYVPGKVRIYCGGMTVVNDDTLATLELHYESSENIQCERLGSNAYECILDEQGKNGPYSFAHSGFIFTCGRMNYIDEHRVAAAATFEATEASDCMKDGRASYSIPDQQIMEDQAITALNMSNDVNGEYDHSQYSNPIILDTPQSMKYISMGHFCQVQKHGGLHGTDQSSEASADSSVRDESSSEDFVQWSLEPNIVVSDGIMYRDQCRNEYANFLEMEPHKDRWIQGVDYCYIRDTDCEPSHEGSSTDEWTCQFHLKGLFSTDSFSKCHDPDPVSYELVDELSTILETVLKGRTRLISTMQNGTTDELGF